jgi:type III secretion protein U
MNDDVSEQKTLPATDKKLQDARKKGQVAHSQDLVSAAGGIVAIVYLWFRLDTIAAEWRDAVLLSLMPAPDGFIVALRRSLSIFADLSIRTLAPLLALILAAGILASLAVTRGPAVSLDPIKPRFNHLNPMQGLKRIFGLRGWIELAKTVVKAVLVGSVLLLVVVGSWEPLVHVPSCGIACLSYMFGSLAKLLLGIAICVFLLAAIIDLLLQRWLFLREMRMTPSELKRERKDLEGHPLIRRAFRQYHQEVANEPRLGVEQATIVIRGPGIAIGLRYVRGETGVPVVVCRGKDSTADAIVRDAAARAIPAHDDAELARSLSSGIRLGSGIPAQYFEPVARALYAVGAVE